MLGLPLSALIGRSTGNLDTSKLMLKRYKAQNPELLHITFQYELKIQHEFKREALTNTAISNETIPLTILFA